MRCNYIFAAWHVFILHIIKPYSLLILYRMKPKRCTIIHTKEHARRQKCNCIGLFPYGKVHKWVGGGTVFSQRYRQRYRLHYRLITVYITVNVAAPQHAACQRQPVYELLSPVAYPLRSITPCFTPPVPLKGGQ